MIYLLYSIKDVELNTYGSIIVIPDEIIMKRQLSNLLRSSNNPYKNFEEKFELHKVGKYDSNTGDIESCNVFVCNLSDLLSKSIDIGGDPNGRERLN